MTGQIVRVAFMAFIRQRVTVENISKEIVGPFGSSSVMKSLLAYLG